MRIEAVVAAIAGRDQDLARPENQIRPGAGPGRQRPINARTQIERPGDRESSRCGDGAGTIQQRWPTSRHRPGEPLTRWHRLLLHLAGPASLALDWLARWFGPGAADQRPRGAAGSRSPPSGGPPPQAGAAPASPRPPAGAAGSWGA